MVSSRIAAVVSSHWLRNQVSNKVRNLRVLDTTWGLTKSGHEAYATEHIPGALFFDLNRCVNPKPYLPRNLPNPACFTDYSQSLGINKDTHLVLYDRGVMVAAARAWWNFRAYGHENVSVLDGGLTRWKNEGFPVESGPMLLPNQRGDFEVKLKTELLKDFEGVRGAYRQGTSQILDARGPTNYKGDAPEPTPLTQKAYEGFNLDIPSDKMRAGHIPGSINLPEDNLIDKDTKCFLSEEKIAEAFRSAGVDLSKPITTLCYNGNAACLVALAATLCGQKDFSVYYGSWTEYGYKASAEDVVTGDAMTAKGVDGA